MTATVITDLTPATRLIIVQLSFSNPAAMPDFVRLYERPPENINAQQARRARNTSQPSGQMILNPTPQVDCADLGIALESDYPMVYCQTQKRLHATVKGKTYWAVRFMFAHSSSAVPESEFLEAQPTLQQCLRIMVGEAYWRVRAFLNPFYVESTAIEGLSTLSINLEGRVPRFLPDGSLIVTRKRDSAGNKIDPPVPLEPTSKLVVNNSRLSLV